MSQLEEIRLLGNQDLPDDASLLKLAALPRLEAAFGRFYDDMERYWIAVAAWDARYGNAYG